MTMTGYVLRNAKDALDLVQARDRYVDDVNDHLRGGVRKRVLLGGVGGAVAGAATSLVSKTKNPTAIVGNALVGTGIGMFSGRVLSSFLAKSDVKRFAEEKPFSSYVPSSIKRATGNPPAMTKVKRFVD